MHDSRDERVKFADERNHMDLLDYASGTNDLAITATPLVACHKEFINL